jgi:hypothetical protein
MRSAGWGGLADGVWPAAGLPLSAPISPACPRVRNATHKIDMGEDLTMMIGSSGDGAPLELGVLGLDGDDPVIIHALPLRAKFYRFLG